MKITLIIALAVVGFAFTVPALAAQAVKQWSAVATLENSGTSGFPGVSYQKTYDQETNIVCYAAKVASSVSISCLKAK